MKIKIRANVFETNSSSMHCLCITKNDETIDPKEICEDLDMYVRADGTLFIGGDRLYFERSPFTILHTFGDKLKYTIASLVGNNIRYEHYDTAKEYLKEIEIICRWWIPDFERLDFSQKCWTDSLEDLDYGYAENYGALAEWLKKNNVSIEDFLTKKKYIVIVDGDEYWGWQKLKDSKIIDTSYIKTEVSLT